MVKVAVWWKKKVLWSSLLYPVAKIEVLERMVWMRCGWEGGAVSAAGGGGATLVFCRSRAAARPGERPPR